MMRKSVGLLLLCLMTFGLAAAAAVPDPVPAAKKAGYGLIDLYISAFKGMSTTGSKDSLDADLNTMLAEAKKAKTAGDIDVVFLARYSRMIAMTKLITLKDPEKAIAPIINAELGRFVRDTLGEEFKTEGQDAIGQIADALTFSIIDLQIYLDTLDSRQQRKDKFVRSFKPEK